MIVKHHIFQYTYVHCTSKIELIVLLDCLMKSAKSACCIRVFLTNEFNNFNILSMYVYLQYLVIQIELKVPA